MGGRPAKPTALKVLEGNLGKRPLPGNEPHPRVAGVTCPSFLGKAAKTEWGRLSKELLELGLLTTVDRAVLAAFCQAWGDLVEAEKTIQAVGQYTETEGGAVRAHPAVKIAKDARMDLTRIAAEFGFTPASRSKISVPEKKEATPDKVPMTVVR